MCRPAFNWSIEDIADASQSSRPPSAAAFSISSIFEIKQSSQNGGRLEILHGFRNMAARSSYAPPAGGRTTDTVRRFDFGVRPSLPVRKALAVKTQNARLPVFSVRRASSCQPTPRPPGLPTSAGCRWPGFSPSTSASQSSFLRIRRRPTCGRGCCSYGGKQHGAAQKQDCLINSGSGQRRSDVVDADIYPIPTSRRAHFPFPSSRPPPASP